MEKFVVVLMVLAMLGVLASLGFGLFYMVKGGKVNAKKSNKMMWRRIWFQGVALVAFALILILAKGD